VLVSRGTCTLDGTRVIGNVHLYDGASLIARGVHVDGNIQAEDGAGADYVDIDNSRVGGDIQLFDLVGDRSHIIRSQVGGNIQMDSNRSLLVVQDNTIDGDVQAFHNTGGVDISRNRIGGNLQCKENFPVPAGGDNTVDGNMEDQCANLQPSTDPAITGGGTGLPGTGGGGGAVSPFALMIMVGVAVARLRRVRTERR
jgi:cytoskeletal protein CcmA (bactofilin family)